MIKGFAIFRDGNLTMFLGYGTREGAEEFARDLGKADPKRKYTVKSGKVSFSEAGN